VKIQELRKKNSVDLAKLLVELKDNVRTLRFRIASKEVKNHQLMRQAKKDVARILTILGEQKHAE
jgi:ribosomal protein L29